MNVPDDLSYTSDHEWARFETQSPAPGSKARVGITDYAQDSLGDIVFIQLPSIGTEVQSGEALGEIESTKSVSDIYSPVSGRVVELNKLLTESPEHLNDDPYGKGWICVIELSAAPEDHSLLDPDKYRQLISE